MGKVSSQGGRRAACTEFALARSPLIVTHIHTLRRFKTLFDEAYFEDSFGVQRLQDISVSLLYKKSRLALQKLRYAYGRYVPTADLTPVLTRCCCTKSH